ncbi:hypothetical protein UlMin_028728 [Ulmus minor]
MKQKIVVKVQMNCNKCRKKAMKIAAMANGVNSVKIEGEDKDRVVVTGDGVDPVCLTSSLRKKVGSSTLLSVEEVKAEPPKQKKKESNDKVSASMQYVPSNCYSQYYCPQPVLVCHDPDPYCSIM